MKKKIISLLLVLALVVGICPAAFAVGTTPSAEIEGIVYAAYIPDVGTESSNLKNNTLDKGKNVVVLDAFHVVQISEGGDMCFAGGLNGVSFDIEAKPYDSPANTNVQVFEANDKLGNYTVLYADIEQNIQDSALYFNNMGANMYANVLKLYLRPVDTPDFLMIELFTSENYSLEYLQKPISEDVNAPGRVNQLWYSKAFYSPLEVSVDDTVAPLYMDMWASTIEYSHNYSHLGYDWRQRLYLKLYIEYPTSFSNTEVFSTGYKVEEGTGTTCITKPNESNEFSNIDAKYLRIDIAAGPGLAAHKYEVSGQTVKAAKASLKINFNTTAKINSLLSVTFNYKDAHRVSLNSAVTAFGAGDYVREFGFDLEDDVVNTKGDYVNLDWTIKNYGGVKQEVPFTVSFSYVTINKLYYSQWSGQTQTKEVTIYTNTTS